MDPDAGVSRQIKLKITAFVSLLTKAKKTKEKTNMELQGRKYKPNQTDRDYAQHEEGCDKEQRETANMYTERY